MSHDERSRAIHRRLRAEQASEGASAENIAKQFAEIAAHLDPEALRSLAAADWVRLFDRPEKPNPDS